MCNGSPITVEKISSRAGLELGSARSVGERLAHLATGAPPAFSFIVKNVKKSRLFCYLVLVILWGFFSGRFLSSLSILGCVILL